MDERLGHVGPLPLLEGVVLSQALSDRVFLETGVRAMCRSRKQWGTGKRLTRVGPIENLHTAWTRVILYGTAVGEGGEGGGGGEGEG